MPPIEIHFKYILPLWYSTIKDLCLMSKYNDTQIGTLIHLVRQRISYFKLIGSFPALDTLPKEVSEVITNYSQDGIEGWIVGITDEKRDVLSKWVTETPIDYQHPLVRIHGLLLWSLYANFDKTRLECSELGESELPTLLRTLVDGSFAMLGCFMCNLTDDVGMDVCMGDWAEIANGRVLDKDTPKIQYNEASVVEEITMLLKGVDYYLARGCCSNIADSIGLNTLPPSIHSLFFKVPPVTI